MQIELADGNTLEWLNETKDHKTAATLDLVDLANPKGFDLLRRRGDHRDQGRGNSTWNRPKKPYQIKLRQRRRRAGMETTTRRGFCWRTHLDPSLDAEQAHL